MHLNNPTTCARTPSKRVALIQHKTFWSCGIHEECWGLISIVWYHLNQAKTLMDGHMKYQQIVTTQARDMITQDKPGVARSIITPVNSKLTKVKTRSTRDNHTCTPVKCTFLRYIYIDEQLKIVRVLYIESKVRCAHNTHFFFPPCTF